MAIFIVTFLYTFGTAKHSAIHYKHRSTTVNQQHIKKEDPDQRKL